MSLDGKVILVTGAARGIGAEVARRAAARGARVALAGLEPDRLAALARELGGGPVPGSPPPREAGLGRGHAWYQCDVTDQEALDSAMAGAVAALGGLDVVVANAGIASYGTVAISPPEALARVVDVNLTGAIRTACAALPHLRARRGYLLFVSSAAALGALPGMAVYAATKIAVQHLAGALRLEVAHDGVDVGVAYPGWIETDLMGDVVRDLPGFDELRRKLPPPFSTVTSLGACAEALVDAVERRRRSVYVPRALGLVAPLRTILWSRLGDLLVRRDARTAVPRMERDVAALGRAFGARSVETARRTVAPAGSEGYRRAGSPPAAREWASVPRPGGDR
jgi:NAD(P)-dependent dehydrogenase (short-subunit alcohol dehydrogenase family)